MNFFLGKSCEKRSDSLLFPTGVLVIVYCQIILAIHYFFILWGSINVPGYVVERDRQTGRQTEIERKRETKRKRQCVRQRSKEKKKEEKKEQR